MLLLFISLEMGLLTTASAYYYFFVVLPGQKLVSLFFTYNSICIRQSVAYMQDLHSFHRR
ncbi:hypothetical protein RDI58_032242 [Solanum bulbocastanum]|uniref:Uncharacterized protein n=1 Tax=Solanum bulbocastanum TaxID=147425 RepID=A0AAN8SL12_SOLBU